MNKLRPEFRWYGIALALLFNCISAFAQTQGSISAKLTDNTGEKLEFAPVALMKAADSSLVKTTMSDENGFSFDKVPFGTYYINISYSGYQTYYSGGFTLSAAQPSVNLTSITLESADKTLETVTITAQQPLLEQEADRTVMHVEKSIMSNGNTALEVLERAPGVTVDEEGNISLKGKQGVTIMINGKLTYLSQKEIASLLRGTSSAGISKVEIISNPSAKYDAAGNSGIINIVMKKNVKPGLNGTVYANGGTSRKIRYGSGFNINYRTGRFNFFGNYDYAFRGEKEYQNSDRQFTGSNTSSSQATVTDEPLNTHNFKVGADINLNDKNSVGFLVNGNLGTYTNKSITDNTITEAGNVNRTRANNLNNQSWGNLLYNLNYMHQFKQTGRELTADIDYSTNSWTSGQSMETNFINPALQGLQSFRKGTIPSMTKIYVFKTDYTHPWIYKIKAEGGLKFSHVTVDNDVRYDTLSGSGWIRDANTTNRFTYLENIQAAYVNFSKEIGKLSIQAGLRAENTHTEGYQVTTDSLVIRNYFQLFPSLFLTNKVNDNNQVQFSYSRRIERPDYEELNPFRFYRDPYMYYEGNPFLKPQLTNSLELGHTFKNKLTTTVNYSQTNNVITWIVKQSDASSGVVSQGPENLSSMVNYGLSISGTFTPASWWNLNAFFNIFKVEYQNSTFQNDRISYTSNIQNSFKIRKGLSAEINGFYRSKTVYGAFVIEPMYWLNVGVQQKILKDKASIKLSVNDLFQTKRFRESSQTGNVNMDYLARLDSRCLMLTFTYNFGNSAMPSKHKDKTDDTQDRVKTGG